ncbi:phage holin family protein [Sphingosinicella humi]|uniref:phage holin family protein n=1 Tax=Allosphingosinicella humi TaxID=2068657 RepID=UPI001304CD61|nr:phage holin family protein [Sphingosinicella humi]
MHGRIERPDDDSLGDLIQQLVEDGRNVAAAEVRLYKQIALYRIGKARTGAIALAAGGFLAFAGLIAALVGLVMGLAVLIGPVAAGLVVLAATGAIAFLLVRFGLGKMAALSGDAEEKAAISAGERNP